jgi:hypothetical protein
MKTFYVVPGVTEAASQCRIYRKDGYIRRAGEDYRKDPDSWEEFGLMNAHGKLVCLQGDASDALAVRE